ncbi:MAG TPA: MFS transporter [Candidatus Limnocylindria bacterium]|nr:MFS transporter [Candidatus Limnocylindria bacterium]
MTGPATRLWTPAFIALALAELAYFTAAGLTIPLTPLFAEGPLGATEVWVGITVGAFSVTAVVLRPYAGRLADRRGRRPLLIGGALLVVVTLAAHAVTTELALLIVLRLVLGVAEAFFFVAGFAALADLAPPGRAGEAISFNSLALYLGLAFGPLIGELLLDAGGFGVAWLGGAGLALLAVLLALTLPETAPHDRAEADPGPLIHRAALGPGLALFAGVTAMAGFLGFVALHARDLRLDGSSGALLLFGLIVVGCRIVFARLPDRVPPYRLGTASLAVIAAGLATIGLVNSPAGLLAGAAVTAVGVAFITPAMFAAVLARVPASERGSALGTVSAFIDLAFGGGPILVGVVAGASSIPVGFMAAAGVAAIGAVGAALALRPREAPATAT